MKFTKEYLNSIALNGYEFVCWENEDNSYYFQKKELDASNLPLYSQLRMLETDITNGSCRFLFLNDMENTKTVKSVKADIAEAWREHKACIREGLFDDDSEVEESLREIEDMEALLLNMVSYQNIEA